MKYRLEYCLTQTEMAKMIHCTQAQLSKWESGTIEVSNLRAKELWRWIKSI